MNFLDAVELVLDHEGGYVNDPKDPGGETKFGISKRSYPDVNISSLSLKQACDIYKRDYWDRLSCDQLPERVRLIVFDCAVNQGQARASMFLQRAVGISDDGVIGARTIKAAVMVPDTVIISNVALLRHNSYARNPLWQVYGAGWSRRLLDITIRCLA